MQHTAAIVADFSESWQILWTGLTRPAAGLFWLLRVCGALLALAGSASIWIEYRRRGTRPNIQHTSSRYVVAGIALALQEVVIRLPLEVLDLIVFALR